MNLRRIFKIFQSDRELIASLGLCTERKHLPIFTFGVES